MRDQLLSLVVVGLFCGGAVAADPAPFPHEPVTRYIARVLSTEDGSIANIHLSGGKLPENGIDLKADVKAFGAKLKELAAKHDKTRPAALTLEIDRQLLYRHFLQLIDTSEIAGFPDAALAPIEKPKR